MTRNRGYLFVTAAAALMLSAPAFAQGAMPSPEAFAPYVADTSSQPLTGHIVMQSGRVKLHEERSSAYVPYYTGTTDTSREVLIHSN